MTGSPATVAHASCVGLPTTICAIATAPGGAIGIVRISGPDAIAIADRIFHGHTKLSEAKTHTTHFGTIQSPVPESERHDIIPITKSERPVLGGNVAEPIDESLATVFRAPHSYTGEDSVELSCHGSQYILLQVLNLLCTNGCRLANPGEFTQRAFLNGKLDLSQAEAVADLIASSSAAAHRMAFSQLKGGFSRELADLRDQLLHLTTLMELELDFSDHEELEFADRSELINLADKINHKITALADSFRQGNAIKNGIPVAIIGAPNVGKSTLLNALLREDKAIVSDIPGTTRDYIEDTITLRGFQFRFIDTAGLRETTDKIESLGIARTKQKIEEAQIILWLSDKEETFASPENLEIFENVENLDSSKVLKLLTKIDCRQPSDGSVPFSPITSASASIPISAKTGQGLQQLEDRLATIAEQLTSSASDIIVTNARHHEALLRASESLHRVLDGLRTNLPTDLVAEDLHLVLSALGEITGAISSQDVLENVWKNFCIGK